MLLKDADETTTGKQKRVLRERMSITKRRRLGLLLYNDNEPSADREFVMREMINSVRFLSQ